MIKKQITYTNPFTDQEVVEEHYFHISKADLVKMEMEQHGDVYTSKKTGEELTGFRAKLQRIIDSEDGKEIMATVEEFIQRAYGIKDGDSFRKSDEIWENFRATEAFSQLLFDLVTNANEAAEFMNGIIPRDLDKIAAEVQAEAEQATREAAVANAMRKEPATGTTQPADPLPPEPESDSELPFESDDTADKITADAQRAKQIAQANAENPVLLTPAEMAAMDSAELQSGLAAGRYKLS